jgi:hypothetical protein
VFETVIIKFELNKIIVSHMVEADIKISEELNSAIIKEIDGEFKK